jgi:hypothetical protein
VREGRHRPEPRRGNRVVEILCVLVVVLAVMALVAWFVLHHGGGVLNQG